MERALRGDDAVCHLAAVGDIYLAGDRRDVAASANVVGSANVGLAAETTGTRVIYASTWEVYGTPLYEPIDEEHPLRPDHQYSITKLAGERLLIAIDHLRDVPFVSFRLGTAYGSGMRPNSVFSVFSRKGSTRPTVGS